MRKGKKSLFDAGGKIISTGLVAAAGWILYSNLAIDHEVTLEEAIPAERKTFQTSRTGLLSYYVDRQATGRPLVLIHSVNAAASAYEMLPLFERYRGRRPVFALDLPGFGFSERSDREYNPQIYVKAIIALLESQVGEPADVLALSLGCEFSALAALASSGYFHSLVMVSPSGFSQQGSKRASQRVEADESSGVVHSILAFPLWSRPLFDLIATRTSIEFFLGRSFVGPIPAGFVDYAYASAHQPGAHHAPLYFLSGKLFTQEVRSRVYEKLDIPVLVIYDEDAYVSFEALNDFVATNPGWRKERITPTRGLPHFEKLTDIQLALDRFWDKIER